MNILFFNVIRWKMADKMTSKIRLSSIKTAVEIQSGLNLCKDLLLYFQILMSVRVPTIAIPR